MHWKVQRLINKGYACIEREIYSEAVLYFEKAAKLEPKTSEIYAYLGEARYLNGDYDKALEAFARRDELILQADPLTPYIEGYRGCAFLEQKEYSQASRLLEKAIAKKVKEPEIYYKLGCLYLQENKRSKAIEMLREIEGIDPSFYHRKIKKVMDELRSTHRQKQKSDSRVLN